MRKPIIAANWKMHKRVAEAKEFMRAIKGRIPASDELETVICAPFVHLPALTELAEGKGLAIGAQNMHFKREGAYTGEISPLMLVDLGIRYVIIGHSERREYFQEKDEVVKRKVAASYEHGLLPIICVGEQLAEREAGQTKEVVGRQVRAALGELSAEQIGQAVIAYEPVWAIGAGQSASPSEANEVCTYIRSVVEHVADASVAETLRIQYGGSVKAENISQFMAQSDIDGALVGGASLDPQSFLQLLEGAQA